MNYIKYYNHQTSCKIVVNKLQKVSTYIIRWQKNEMSHWHFVHDVGMCGNLMWRLIAKKLHIIACELHRIYDIVYDKGVHYNCYNLSNSIQNYINIMSCKCMLQMENPVAMDNSFDEWIILGEIIIKRTKVLVDGQFFIYPIYFEIVSHINLNDINILFFTLCSFTHEVIIPWIWSHFIVLWRSFWICKRLVDVC